MRIDSSSIGMQSSRSYVSVSEQTELGSIMSMVKKASVTKEENAKSWVNGEIKKESTKEKKTAEDSMLELKNKFESVSKIKSISKTDNQDPLKAIQRQCMLYLLTILRMGRIDHQTFSQQLRGTESENECSISTSNIAVESSSSMSGITKSTDKNWDAAELLTMDMGSEQWTGMTGNFLYQNSYSYMEEEQTCFSTQGTVKTAEGKEITFHVNMAMSRSFRERYEETYELQSPNLCDPLVINLNGNVATLTDQKFTFDLDGDGVLDNISRLNANSGYLALDQNGDGTINDGSELFGTKSGNGFSDLSKYDEDQNGWIDENDSIWKKMVIWTKDENGKDTLHHLKESGVGAICLENVDSEFAIHSMKNNDTKGVIRNTGIFLFENGGVGTVQHLDIAK